MAPGTEFARDFCAGIGPLQLGVGLVYFSFGRDRKSDDNRTSNEDLMMVLLFSRCNCPRCLHLATQRSQRSQGRGQEVKQACQQEIGTLSTR